MKYPLMRNNITREDLDVVIEHLKNTDPRLTAGEHVRLFEKNWSDWLGVKHSVFVNSGASANLVTLSVLKTIYPEGGEVIVPPLHGFRMLLQFSTTALLLCSSILKCLHWQ